MHAPRTISAIAALSLAGAAFGQSTSPMLFVSNNGNLEGSVTSLRIEEDGSLSFVQKLVTGSVPQSGLFDPGLNANAIDVTPDGRFVAVGHATASETVERITLLEVAADGTMSVAGLFTTPDSPLDLKFIDDEFLAATRTSLSATNQVIVYRLDRDAPGGPELVQVDSETTGGFSTSLAVHPSRTRLFAQDSAGNTVRIFSIDGDGILALLDVVAIGGYPLGLGVSPDGRFVYAGGGISGGGKNVHGLEFASEDGVLSIIPGSPWISPGQSPKQVVLSGDGAWAFVGHGTDATIRGFEVDPRSGALAPNGFSFDVGLQGTLQEIAVLGSLLFATDNSTALDGVRGVHAFTIQSDGSLLANGAIVDTQGVAPTGLAAWSPPRRGSAADLDGDGAVNGADLGLLLAAWGSSGPGDLDGSGVVDGGDLGLLLAEWNN